MSKVIIAQKCLFTKEKACKYDLGQGIEIWIPNWVVEKKEILKNKDIRINLKDLDANTIEKFQLEELMAYATDSDHVVPPTHKHSPKNVVASKAPDNLPDPEVPFDSTEFVDPKSITSKIAIPTSNEIRNQRIDNELANIRNKLDKILEGQNQKEVSITIKIDENSQNFITGQMESLKDIIVGLRQVALLVHKAQTTIVKALPEQKSEEEPKTE